MDYKKKYLKYKKKYLQAKNKMRGGLVGDELYWHSWEPEKLHAEFGEEGDPQGVANDFLVTADDMKALEKWVKDKKKKNRLSDDEPTPPAFFDPKRPSFDKWLYKTALEEKRRREEWVAQQEEEEKEAKIAAGWEGVDKLMGEGLSLPLPTPWALPVPVPLLPGQKKGTE